MVVVYITSTLSPSESRCSERERTATNRFAESWFSAKLRSLSLALGLGVADSSYYAKIVPEASSFADETVTMVLPEDEDETLVPDVTMEVLEAAGEAEAAAPKLRRSERERMATDRFVEGWFGVRLPALSSALGLTGSGGERC